MTPKDTADRARKTEPEKRFSEWLESIRFVDAEGKLLPHILEEDEDLGEDGP